MAKYKTIQEVVEAVQAGEVDETKLEIVQDNDCSDIYCGPHEDEDYNSLAIFRGEGYADTDALWKLVFPKAFISNC